MAKKRISKQEKMLTKELLYILGFMIALVLIFVAVSFFFKSFNTFEYEGMTFTKERLGEIPIFHYYYYFNNKNNVLVQYNLYLRNDTWKNNIVIEGDEIFLEKDKVVFLTVEKNENLNNCPRGVLGIANLVSFLNDNGYVTDGGNPDFHEAKEKGETWINCETHALNPVIKIVKGEKSKLKVDGNCYEISVESCEDFLPSTENFILQMIIDARERLGIND